MAGTGTLLGARDNDTLGVRRQVTSPGGITAKAVAALERHSVRAAFDDAVQEVVNR
jgi:pyrroline-5-carboxylate reductase